MNSLIQTSAAQALLHGLDTETLEHSKRVFQLAGDFGAALGLSRLEIERLENAAMFHDIGKSCLPTQLLNSSERLTDNELSLIRQHPNLGARLLNGFSSLKFAVPVALYHHEQWAGNGYPSGLLKEEIPLHARIVAIVDAYDAMTSNRPYRAGYTARRARVILEAFAGIQFDPDLVTAFLSM